MIEQEWLWATAGSVFLLAEIFLGTQFFLFFMGISCYLSALVFFMYPEISYELSLVIVGFFFCLSPCIWFVYFRPYYKARGDHGDVNDALYGLKGHVITLEDDMNAGKAKVTIKHSLWDIRSISGQNFKAGESVKVVDIDGVILLVEKHQDQ